MQDSNKQKQERTEKMIVLKKSPKWWATAAATGGLVVGMTSGFGLECWRQLILLPYANKQQSLHKMATNLPKILKDKIVKEMDKDKMDILTHKLLMIKMVDLGKVR